MTPKVKCQGYNVTSSVLRMLADNSTTKSRRSTKIGRMVVCATADICTSSKIKRSEVKVTRPLIAVTKNQPYLRNWKEYKLQTWYMIGSISTNITRTPPSSLAALKCRVVWQFDTSFPGCPGIQAVILACVLPRAGSAVVRIDPLRFLAWCCTRRLNQV